MVTHVTVIILKLLFVRAVIAWKRRARAYVSSERAELKGRFAAVSRRACFRLHRVHRLGGGLQGALRTNEWPNSRGNKEFVRALNTTAESRRRLKCLSLFLPPYPRCAAWQFYLAEGVPRARPLLRVSRGWRRRLQWLVKKCSLAQPAWTPLLN